jgi:hypothetical protein
MLLLLLPTLKKQRPAVSVYCRVLLFVIVSSIPFVYALVMHTADKRATPSQCTR